MHSFQVFQVPIYFHMRVLVEASAGVEMSMIFNMVKVGLGIFFFKHTAVKYVRYSYCSEGAVKALLMEGSPWEQNRRLIGACVHLQIVGYNGFKKSILLVTRTTIFNTLVAVL